MSKNITININNLVDKIVIISSDDLRNPFIKEEIFKLVNDALRNAVMDSDVSVNACTECAGTGNASIEKDTVHIPCTFCGGEGKIYNEKNRT